MLPSQACQQVVGDRGVWRSEIKEERRRSRLGGHSRSRTPRALMTALAGEESLGYRGHQDSSQRKNACKPKIARCLPNAPSNP